ncbi:MAG: DivIVA domain-containing protein [Oscillospiraceae bacterium]|nr:DivIVA domain-containing protein [Oscillospiraceae bacterium]
MITAQDIREKTFEKARVGGYEMGSVDDFLDQLAVELEAAHKENAVLKSKMKVLVDKIEEYRTNEEAAQRALLSAQKLAIQIEGDARNRAAAMLAEAERQVQAQIGSISQQARNEEDRLAAAKSATARYVRAAAEAFNRQLRSLENVSRGFMPEEAPAPAPVPVEEPAPAPAPVEEAEEPAPAPAPAPAGSIEDTLARLQALDSAPAEDEAPLTL